MSYDVSKRKKEKKEKYVKKRKICLQMLVTMLHCSVGVSLENLKLRCF